MEAVLALADDEPEKRDRTWLEEVAERVRAEVGQLSDRRDALAAELAEATAELKQAQSILKTVAPEDFPVAPPKKKQGGPKQNGPRAIPFQRTKNAAVMARAIVEVGDRQFTAIDIHRQMPWAADPTTYTYLNKLRDLEVIGRGGKDPDTKRTLWRVLDAEALAELAQGGE